MARDFAQIRLSVWLDEGWTSLSLEQQAVYLTLCSQPTINLAGVIDFLPGRLSRLSAGVSAARIREIVSELQEREMVFVDEDTDELLVRSMIRSSDAWRTPNSARAIARNVEQTLSGFLRSVLLYEVQRVLSESDEKTTNGKSREVLATLAATLVRGGLDPWRKGSGNPSANPYPNPSPKGYVNPYAMGSGNPSANPSPKGLPGDGDGDGTEGDGDGLRASLGKTDASRVQESLLRPPPGTGAADPADTGALFAEPEPVVDAEVMDDPQPDDIAKALLSEWWERQDPRPAGKGAWPSGLNSVKSVLRSGHDPNAVRAALQQISPPLSIPTLEFRLNAHKRANTARPQDDRMAGHLALVAQLEAEDRMLERTPQ